MPYCFESVLLSELKEDTGNCDRLLQSCSTNGFLVMEWGLWNLLEFTWESSSDGGVNSILLTVNKSSDNSMWNLLEEVCVSQFFYLIYCYFYYEYRFLRLNQDYSVNFVFQAEDAGKINQYEQKTVKILVRAILYLSYFDHLMIVNWHSLSMSPLNPRLTRLTRNG